MKTKKVAIPTKVDLAPLIAAQIVPMDCTCDGCAALARLYGSDSELHLFYRRRLLQRGWAGKSREAPEERLFQKFHVGWATTTATGSGLFGTPVRGETAPEPEDEESGVEALEVPA